MQHAFEEKVAVQKNVYQTQTILRDILVVMIPGYGP